MGFFVFLLDFLIQLLSNASILISLFIMAGMMVRKKKKTEIITSIIKTLLGFNLISGSSTFIVGSIIPLNTMTATAFGFTGVVPSNEACYGAAAGQFGTALSGIIIAAMAINIVIAKFTRFSFIYLTGHEMMWVSTCCAFVFSAAGLPLWQIIVAGGLVTGMYMAIFPSLIHKDVCKITGSQEISIAHTGSVLYWVAARFAALVGDPKDSIEDAKIPEGMAFLKDWNVSLSLVMFALYFVVSVVCLIAVPGLVEKAFGEGVNFIIGSINYALQFTTGVFILMAGVRLVVGEIVPSFRGISEKFIPNAVASLDIPIVYPYYPTGTLVGFLCCTVAFILAFFVNIALHNAVPAFPVILPNVINAFYYGATYACVANPNGGKRGVILATLIIGFFTHFAPGFLIWLGGLEVSGTTFGGADTVLIGVILNTLNKFIGNAVFYVIIALFVLVLVFGHRKKDGKKEVE